MFWEQKDAVECLCVDWTVIGSVFPFKGFWAAALQGEYMKTARTKKQARAYIEKHAETHLRKLHLKDYRDNYDAQESQNFEPDYADLVRRENAANNIKRKTLADLEF